MNYRAACPHCTSVFRIGDDQLAAAQGWVQCGVCGGAFDARLSLRMEDGTTLPMAHDSDASPAPQPPETGFPYTTLPPEPLSGPAAETEPSLPAAPVPEPEPIAPPAALADAAEPAAETPRGIREREAGLDLPSIILIDPNLPGDDDPGPLPVIDPQPAAAFPSSSDLLPETAESTERPSARIEYAQPVPGPARIPARARHPSPWVWGSAIALLAIGLAGQAAYFLRDTLASRMPETRPALEQACALLGCTLSLPKNLDQLQIVGSDLQVEGNGQLRLVLTLGNRAAQPQAWPVLILTLSDRSGKPLARRSFAPSEYLDNAAGIAAGMPARSEQPLDLPLTVRNLAPMGFDLRLSY
ncbi:MAG: hypothetical protein BGO61_08185 [Thiobacillus sp. 65-69]|nr:zinc-ribbon and DUF3426 domain-containing protein [Thiobacillus sp.]ODU90659.1 MAG: hypothetical protein ABT21_01015 [Thiobacillus sp. SCN 65-179]OJW35912.1 MAG: hypothetical protein BGO61_08185 [Thiobacillus sp. 65-69]